MNTFDLHQHEVNLYLAAQVGVKRAYVFGSVARKEQDEHSDIDIMLELDYHQNRFDYFTFFDIKEKLEHIYSCKVDLVTESGLDHKLKAVVDAEKILLYERS